MSSRFRDIREAEGVSRAALARASDVSDRTIKRIEDEHEYSPSRVTMNRLRIGLNKVASVRHDYALDELFDSEGSER